MPERRKRVLQNTKIRAAAFTCCLLFPQKRARTFPGGLAQTPSAISRCLRATSFPLHFAAAFHSSNIPFFLFSFFYSFSFSLFFSFFLLPLFSLFLVYTFFFLAFFYPLFCFLFPTLFFFSLFFISITMHVFRVHHPKGWKTERSSVSRSMGKCHWRGFGAAPRILFFFFFMYSFMYACFLSGRQADSGRGSGECAYVKVHIKIT